MYTKCKYLYVYHANFLCIVSCMCHTLTANPYLQSSTLQNRCSCFHAHALSRSSGQYLEVKINKNKRDQTV